jgi:hypothetical protein
LSALSKVTLIKAHFLDGCSELTNINLTSLSNVTSIGKYFLGGCSGLTNIDLTSLSNVTSIGKYFLGGCSGLTEINLSHLSNVIDIKEHFLKYCSGLRNIDEHTGDKLVAFNKDTENWKIRKTLLLIRNFAPKGNATNAMKLWPIMQCVANYSTITQVFDMKAIFEEERMLQIFANRNNQLL